MLTFPVNLTFSNMSLASNNKSIQVHSILKLETPYSNTAYTRIPKYIPKSCRVRPSIYKSFSPNS